MASRPRPRMGGRKRLPSKTAKRRRAASAYDLLPEDLDALQQVDRQVRDAERIACALHRHAVEQDTDLITFEACHRHLGAAAEAARAPHTHALRARQHLAGPGAGQGALLEAKVAGHRRSLRPAGEDFGNHSGLGLAIARSIVEAHYGTLRADDRLDGEPGARLVVDLPAWEAA